MNKLNDLYSKHTDSSQKLTNENFNLENEFVQKLKELESESIKIENNIQSLKDEKADILADIVEAERQILLWERKIQLEKEMQNHLDPSYGQKEIVLMKKEIHRMELQYEKYRKRQEELIKDMERAVFKRETIQMNYLPKVEKKNTQVKGKNATGKPQRQIANLKQTLKHTTESSIQLDSTIEQKVKELEQVTEEIEKSRAEIDQGEQRHQENQLELVALKMAKQKNMFNIISCQTQAKRCDEAATGRFAASVGADAVDEAVDMEFQKVKAIEEVLQRVKEENQDISPLIDVLLGWESSIFA